MERKSRRAHEHRQRQRRRRHLDHAADLDRLVVGDALVVELLLRLLDHAERLLDLVRVREHRQQDPDLAELRGAQDRAQLREEQLRLGEAVADRAQAERRVGHLDRVRLPRSPCRRRGPACGSPPGARPSPSPRRGRPRTARPRRAAALRFMNRNSVRNRPTPCAPDSCTSPMSCGSSMLANSSTGVPSSVADGRRLQALELLPLQAVLRLAQPVLAQHHRVGVDHQHALQAVDDQQVVLADHLARVVQADQRRDVQAARDDRGVRGHAADVGDEAAELVALEEDHVGGRKVVRDHDQVALGRGQRLGAAPGRRRAPSAPARPPARCPGAARAGRGPPSPRTARPAFPSAAPAPIRRWCGARGSARAAPATATSPRGSCGAG